MESLDQACELCYVAKKYMLPHLLKNCMEFIWKDVDCDTVIRAYEFAKLFDDPGILDKSMKVRFANLNISKLIFCIYIILFNLFLFQLITERTTEILSKAGVLSMNEKTLLDILHQDQLNVPSEMYLFNIVQSWVLFNISRSGNVI